MTQQLQNLAVDSVADFTELLIQPLVNACCLQSLCALISLRVTLQKQFDNESQNLLPVTGLGITESVCYV